MQDHCREEQELYSKDQVVARFHGEAGRRAAEHEIDDSRDEQEHNRDPGDGLKTVTAVIEDGNPGFRRQGVGRGCEDEEKKEVAPDP